MNKLLIVLLLSVSLNALTITQYLEAKHTNKNGLEVYLSGMSSGIFVLSSLSNQTGICFPKDFAGFTVESVFQIIDLELTSIKEVNKHYAPTDPVEVIFLIGLIKQFSCILPDPKD